MRTDRAADQSSVQAKSRGRLAAFASRATVLIAGIALVTAASAQTSVLDPNYPSGSPLSGQTQSGDDTGSQQNEGSGNTYYPQPSQRVGPTEIQPVQSDSSQLDQRENTVDTDNGTDAAGQNDSDQRTGSGRNGLRTQGTNPADTETSRTVRPALPNEFEKFVAERIGHPLPRFGANLIVPSARNFALPSTTTVPPGYKLAPGDQVFIGLSGSIEGSVSRTIDTDGKIFLPHVGEVNLAGVSYVDLKTAIEKAVGIKYRGFDVAVAVTRLRGIRVYVTGFANVPGAYSVNSLSTLVNAVLAAGGPSSGGSFRSIKLFRNGELISDFDLYDFIRNGDKSKDAVLQNQDVIYIEPLGAQVALTGSVNDQAIYESKPGESVADLLRYAGGLNDLADKSRVVIYTLSNAATVGGVTVPRDAFATTPAAGGDIIDALSTGTLAQPLERQNVLVRLDGEVNRPGDYFVKPGTELGTVIAQAGGLTPRAFVFGTNLKRLSVQKQQRESFDEAVQQVELTLASAPLASDPSLNPAGRAAQLASARAVLDRLRAAEPDGRVVLPVEADSQALPSSLVLENDDTVFIPPRPTTIGVFGAVYRPASFLVEGTEPLRVRDYLSKAGGPLRVADKGQIFVIHANGAVATKHDGALSARVLPGDVIFVPVKTANISFLTKLAQISAVLFQAGLGAAAFVAVTQ